MKKIFRFFFTSFLIIIFSPVAQAGFSDVSTSYPYYEAINYLQENEIVQGYDDGTFQPDKFVNRAEALKIILLGSDILVPEIQEQDIFPDVLYSTWFAKYVAKAKNLGIVSGDGDTGLFRPGDTVNLAEILKILLNTNQIETDYPSSNPYADVPADAWFAPFFNYAASISLLPQSSTEPVYPATQVTRGLMAELMYQLILKPKGYAEGEASYYGENFHGKTTASGEVFDASGFTAAHRTFPFGTWVKVKNFENGKVVYVRINDRGPYAGDRIIDLSKAAFEAISPLSRGVIHVAITPLDGLPPDDSLIGPDEEPAPQPPTQEATSDCPEKEDLRFLSKTTFDNITLDQELPSHILENEVLTLSGSSASSNESVSAFIVDENENQYSFYTTQSNGDFSVNVFFPEPGIYQLGILPGSSGSSIVENITVLPQNCLSEAQNTSLTALSNVSFDIEGGDTYIRWDESNDYQLFKIAFTQSDKSKTYYVYDTNVLKPYYPDFEDFTKGSIKVTLQGADLTNKSLLEPEEITWNSPYSKYINIDTHHEYIIEEDSISISALPDYLEANILFEIEMDPLVDVQSTAQIILPNGQVEDVDMESFSYETIINANDLEVFSESADDLKLFYRPTSNQIHFVEVNDDQGLAVLNIPLYPQNVYPLLPNPVELAEEGDVDLDESLNTLRNQMLELVNTDRADHDLSPLVLDSNLNSLAQFRSDDMVSRSYFSHWDPEGNTANDLRKDFAVDQFVSENIARDISVELAEYGLMRSASHRANILKPEWKRAGFGITQDGDNGIIFVQIFSDDPIDYNNLTPLRNRIRDDLNDVRTSDYILLSNLNNIAQSWSEKMVSEDFFDFMAPDSSTLVDSIRDAGVTSTLGTYIVGNSSFEDAIAQITANTQIKDGRWNKLGVGIKQDEFGIIKITLIYTE